MDDDEAIRHKRACIVISYLIGVLLIGIGIVGSVYPIAMYADDKGENDGYHQGVCVITGNWIVYAGERLIPMIRAQATPTGSESTSDVQIVGPSCRTQDDVSKYLSSYPTGSNSSCWWRTASGQGVFGTDVPWKNLLPSMIPMIILLSLFGIGAILVSTCCCAENVFDYGRSVTPITRHCSMCEARYYDKKANRYHRQLCERCTVYDSGVREFLNGQGTELQNFVSKEVIQFNIRTE